MTPRRPDYGSSSSRGRTTSPAALGGLVGSDLKLARRLSAPAPAPAPAPERAAVELAQVISKRNERGSLIVTTNLPFGEWTKVFLEARLPTIGYRLRRRR